MLRRALPADPSIRARVVRAFAPVPWEVQLESALALSAAVWAIAMALGPLLQIRKIVEHRNSDNVSVGYFLVLLVGFVLWFAYGIASSNLALVIPNTVAAVVIVAAILVALRYRRSSG